MSNTDNIVDGNNTILGLIYGNTTGFHTTFINPGQTLTVTNPAAANSLWVGTATDNGGSEIVNTTIIGPGGALVVANTNILSQMVVQQGSGTPGTHNATLNMAALGSFNLTAGRLLVGAAAGSSINASNYLSGTLILARTNVIQLIGSTTPTFDVGDAVNNGAAQLVQLGQTNAVYAGTLTVAHTKATATVQFNPSLAGSNPTLYLRSSNTVGRVAVLAIGDMSGTSGSGSSASGNLNLSLGTVDAQVNACYVGKGQSSTGSGPATGVLTLGAGVFNVNTLNAGYLIAANTTGAAIGTVNVTSTGTLVVNTNLALGVNPGASSTSTGTLNITNGTVYANSITNVGGNYNSTINVAGGTLVVSNTAGTTAAPITTLAVSNAILTLKAAVSGATVSAGSLNFYGTADTLNLSVVPPTTTFPSQYPVISYAGGSLNGAYDFSLGTLPAPYLGYVSNNTANSSVDVVITNVNVKLDVWNGNVNGNWDATTLNWLYNGGATTYHAGDFVQFDDTLSGTANVTLTTSLAPGTLVVTNSTHNYVFSGGGELSGALGLSKNGAGTLTLAETGGDSFSGESR